MHRIIAMFIVVLSVGLFDTIRERSSFLRDV